MTERRVLGMSDIAVSPVAMGCWAIVGDQTWGDQDEEAALAAIRAALDAGVNFFDTAEGYGAGYSEQLLGKALGARRDEAVIGSKVSPSNAATYEDLVAACDRSLANLGTDRIDVYHLHWPNRDVPVGEILEGLERLKQAGKIRCVAVSNFGPGDLAELCRAGRVEVNQLPYNLLFRAIEYGIQPICTEQSISITCYSPIMQGLLTGKFAAAAEVPEGRARTRHFSGARAQTRHGEAGCEAETFAAVRAIGEVAVELGCPTAQLALAWLMYQPGVASVLVGARSPAQMRENAQAMQLELSDDILERLGRITAPLKERLGSNPDMWQSASRCR